MKLASDAFVAFTTQLEPTAPGVSTLPAKVQVPETTEYETAPLPEPPLVVSVRVEPYATDVSVIVNAV